MSNYLQLYYEILKNIFTKWIQLCLTITYKCIPNRTFSSRQIGDKVNVLKIQTKALEKRGGHCL